MFFSIIIPTCNRNALLEKALKALNKSAQTIANKDYEIIVSDDSANDVVASSLTEEFDCINAVRGPRKGPAANRNNGAKQAKGDWLIFIDDDCIPDKNLLHEYMSAIKDNPGCLAFEGAIFPDDEKLLQKDLAECPVNTDGGCFWSANICIQKNLFKKIGGFNEQFLIAAQEDQELYSRIKKHTRVVFCKNCKVVHPVRYRGLKEKIERIPIEMKNWILFARMQQSWWQIFLSGSGAQIKACVKTIKQNKFKAVLYHLFSLAYLVPGIILFTFQHNDKQKI